MLTANGDACEMSTMGSPVFSAVAARRAARKPSRYLLWVTEVDASRFQEPGWVRLEPPRNGAVLFLHRERELGMRLAREASCGTGHNRASRDRTQTSARSDGSPAHQRSNNRSTAGLRPIKIA